MQLQALSEDFCCGMHAWPHRLPAACLGHAAEQYSQLARSNARLLTLTKQHGNITSNAKGTYYY